MTPRPERVKTRFRAVGQNATPAEGGSSPLGREISTLEKEFFETTSRAPTSIRAFLKPHTGFPVVVFSCRGGRVEKGNSRCYL